MGKNLEDNLNNIRNFCIISHIDHGKSTLADRFLELTGTIPKKKMRAQFLDQMELEREKGITIKLQPVQLEYQIKNSQSECQNSRQIQDSKQSANNLDHLNFRFKNCLEFANSKFILNLIDTPGHVDFSYEVSRSLAAVEGAILLVDATQGIQAQTLANLHLALKQHLVIIPVVNKIDLPNAEIERTIKEMKQLLFYSSSEKGFIPEQGPENYLGKENEPISISAKTGEGVEKILEATIERIPPPDGDPEAPLRALIFDSSFDEYKGIIIYVRIVDGQIIKGDKIKFIATEAEAETLEVGVFKPQMISTDKLNTGQIGYIATGLKEVEQCRVGDTVTVIIDQKAKTKNQKPGITPLLGYKEIKPMVFAGLFCKIGDDFPKLREALGKLKLTDASLIYEPEKSSALGFGFRCGFLGLLHLEIIQERLKREYGLDLIVTAPSVAYRMVI